MGGWTMYRGAPDLMLLGPGPKHGWIEVKREDGKLTALQVREHARLREAGFWVGVVFGDSGIERVLAEYLGQTCSSYTVSLTVYKPRALGPTR